MALAPQSPAAPTIHPFLKEPPAGSSLHKYYLELSATPTPLENGTAGSAATQQQETPCINLEVLDVMDFLVNLPAKDQPQAGQPPTSAAPTVLEIGAAASVSTQQEEGPCIGLSVQDAADLVAELLADFPAKYQPQASQPSTSARTMCYSDIGPFMQPPPVSHRAEPSPAVPPGRTQPSAACCHPGVQPPSVIPAKRAKRSQLATAPSVGPGLLAPLEGSPSLTGPQDCAPATGAGTINVSPSIPLDPSQPWCHRMHGTCDVPVKILMAQKLFNLMSILRTFWRRGRAAATQGGRTGRGPQEEGAGMRKEEGNRYSKRGCTRRLSSSHEEGQDVRAPKGGT